MSLKLKNASIEFLKHASTLIHFEGKNIYIDPWKIPSNPPKADLILITHEHYDHMDPEKIKEISTNGTVIATNETCCAKMSGNIKTIKIGETTEIFGVKITGVEAYNINKPFHPRGLGIGFVMDFNGEKIYHAGDTDFIPEMKNLKEIDVALLPIGGTYTMNEEEAAQAANAFKPKIAVPMHFNVIDGTSADPKKFSSLVSSETKVEVLYR